MKNHNKVSLGPSPLQAEQTLHTFPISREDVVGDCVKGLTEVQINDICSPSPVHPITGVHWVGQAGLALGEALLAVSNHLIFKMSTMILQIIISYNGLFDKILCIISTILFHNSFQISDVWLEELQFYFFFQEN